MEWIDEKMKNKKVNNLMLNIPIVPFFLRKIGNIIARADIRGLGCDCCCALGTNHAFYLITEAPRTLEVLPVAAPPPKRQLSDQELENLRAMEENILRELRLFLRQIVWKLMADRKFKEFLKPVDLEEVPQILNLLLIYYRYYLYLYRPFPYRI